MTTPSPIEVGSHVTTKRASGVYGVAERGGCDEAYELAGRPGWSFIVASGRDAGFSPADVDTFLEVTGEVCQEVAAYRFRTVWRLCRDFQQGRFDPAFHVKPATPPDTDRPGNDPGAST